MKATPTTSTVSSEGSSWAPGGGGCQDPTYTSLEPTEAPACPRQSPEVGERHIEERALDL